MNPSSVDLTRAVAISLVVLLHMSANSFASFGDYWWVSLTYDTLTRSSVPVFFMLSGALLLKKNEPPLLFFKKRISKIIIPLIFWSYVYLLYRKYYVGETNLSLSVREIINGPVYYHLWFVYSILSVYLFIPMLRFYSINATKNVKLLVLSMWFFSQSIQPFSSFFGINLYVGVDAGLITRFVGFALLGEYLANHPPIKNKSYLLFIFLISSLATAVTTWFISYQSKTANETWFQYHSPFIILSGIALFLLLINTNFRIERVPNLISRYSFGIYFIHIIIMQQICVRFILKPEYFNSALLIILIPIAFLVNILISTAICIALSNIPYLKRVV